MTNLQIYTQLPDGLQLESFTKTESDISPEVRIEGGNVVIPCFCTVEEREIETGTAKVFCYYEAVVHYSGQDITDYQKCLLQSYSGLRKHFYGEYKTQLEQQLKGVFTKHQYAVRQAFPKFAGQTFDNVVEFNKIKGDFWAIIDEQAALIHKERKDFPKGTSSGLIEFCLRNGMTQEQIANFAIQILGITADLQRFGRNWEELF